MKTFPAHFLLFSLFITGALLTACASLDMPQGITRPVSKVFHADFQKVWRAAMLTMEDYPIEEENNETGYLKTEAIKTETIWKFPFEREQNLNTDTYTIHIRFIKGKSQSKPVVKVLVLKKILSQKGFIEEPQRKPSDGLEEKTILYRMMREINIEQAISNYHKSSS